MHKNKSPLKHLEEGHVILTKKGHVEAHDGDAVAAGVSIPEEKQGIVIDSVPDSESEEDTSLENKTQDVALQTDALSVVTPLIIGDEIIDDELYADTYTTGDLLSDPQTKVYQDAVLDEGQLQMKHDQANYNAGTYKEESVFPENRNDGKGNYYYSLGGIEVKHLEDLSGAVSWDTFRRLSTGMEDINVERYIVNNLNNMHQNYKDTRTTEQNPGGYDKNGYYYTFKSKPLTGDDELVITRNGRRDDGSLTKETIEIELPTDWSEDGEMMWNNVYKRYIEFTNPMDAGAEMKALDQVVFNWDKWATDIKGADNIEDYVTKIAPNTQEIVEGKGMLAKYSREGSTTIRPGDSRGGISKVTLTSSKYSDGIQYWTAPGSKQLSWDKHGNVVRWKDFIWPPNSNKHQRYDAGSGFIPPKYDEDGRLLDGGTIEKFEAYEFMYDDYTRGKKVIEDLFYDAVEGRYEDINETGVDVISSGTYNVKPAETETSSKNKLQELQQEQENEIYSETEVLENITYKDIIEKRAETTSDILESENYKKESLDLQAEFSISTQRELEVLLEPHKEEIQNTLNTEFKVEVDKMNGEVEKLHNSFELEDEQVVNGLQEQIQKELIQELKDGTFDPVSDQEYNEEFKKRVVAKYKEHISLVEKDRKDQIESITTPFNEEYNKRYRELTTQYTGGFMEQKTKELEDLFYKHQSEFIKKSYESKSNGAEQLISDEIYHMTFKRLQEQNISSFGYETQKKAIDLAWRKMEVDFDKYLNEDEVDARRKEFYNKAYEKISLDKDSRPTTSGMKIWAEETIEELKALDDLSKAEKKSLIYAEKILEAPEFMSSTAVGRYFDGMFSKEFSDLIPIYANIKAGNRENYIRKLLEKPAEQLTERDVHLV